MKLNNGKGWEAMKQHPSQQHLHAANAMPNASARALPGDTPRGPQTPITAARLNGPQPPPPHPAKPGVGKTRDRPGATGATQLKRQSGAAGGLTDIVTPTASTQAQFQSSTANLPHRMSQATPGMSPQAVTHQTSKPQNSEPQPSAFQKFMKILCCGKSKRRHSRFYSSYDADKPQVNSSREGSISKKSPLAFALYLHTSTSPHHFAVQMDREFFPNLSGIFSITA